MVARNKETGMALPSVFDISQTGNRIKVSLPCTDLFGAFVYVSYTASSDDRLTCIYCIHADGEMSHSLYESCRLLFNLWVLV